MSLVNLIRKSDKGGVATDIPATVATFEGGNVLSVAGIATISVANGLEPPPFEDAAKALDRTLAYLTAPDDRLPGLCLFSQDDIQDIESGVLPLDNAKRYLEQMEQQFPHLQSGGDDSGDHPLLKAMDDLKHSGIELVPEDRRYIRDKIGHRMNWATFLDGYKREWLAAMDGCLPHQKQNRGRFAANTWLNGGAL